MRALKKSLLGLLVLVLFLVAAVFFVYARMIEPNQLVVTQMSIDVPPEVVAGRVVFFTDTHFGTLYGQHNMDRIVEIINKQRPDIVVFGGDLFDNYARDSRLLDLASLQDSLLAIKAPQGKFAVFGNHDYGGGAVRVYEDLMSAGGFTVLNNTNAWVKGKNLRIVGFDDLLMGSTNPALYTLESESFNIVVSHEPDVADRVSMPTKGVMLAGHSHGGQVWVPFVTRYILPAGATTYVKGRYADVGKNQNIELIVSSGIGVTGLPYRFLNVPEILVLDLVPPQG